METNQRNGPVVYIASAFSGDPVGNSKKTMQYSRCVIEKGGIPLNPILNLLGVITEDDRDTAMKIDLCLLKRADELWVFGDPTPGMQREIAEAKRLGLETKYFDYGGALCN